MKTLKVLLGLALGLSLSLSSTVLAEGNGMNATGTTSPSGIKGVLENVRETLREKNENVREEMKKESENAREEMKTNRETVREQIKKIREDQKDSNRKRVEVELKNHISNVGDRFENVIENLTKISARIDARIAILKQAGKDVAGAEALSVDAKTNIQTAKDAIAKLPELETEGMQAEKLSLGLADLRAEINAIEKNLKTAKEDMSKIIGLIKGLGGVVTPANTTATTTPATAQ
ncbi:MAG: hypothetical protein WA051_01965 [Minisyncoccia bacterium]